MFYFRSLPDIKILFKTFFSLLSETIDSKSHQFKFDQYGNSYQLFFQKSRESMNFIINHFFIQKKRKIQIFIPALYCWEILHYFNYKQVDFIFYPITDDFSPHWDYLEDKLKAKKIDIVIYTSFFGIPIDVNKARSISSKENIYIFFDETHSVYPTVVPQKNEYVFMSNYKQFPIPNGSVTLLNEVDNHDLIKEYNKIEIYPTFKSNLIWFAKSIYILITRRKRYLKNDYESNYNYVNSDSSDFIFSKGMSKISYQIIKNEFNNQSSLHYSYNKIQLLINKLLIGYNYEYINYEYRNSHLFAIKFANEISANSCFTILKNNYLPVVTWPEKPYIKVLPEEFKNSIVEKIDKMLFICTFYNN